jgi:hypothetical protein
MRTRFKERLLSLAGLLLVLAVILAVSTAFVLVANAIDDPDNGCVYSSGQCGDPAPAQPGR